jgi:DUF1680 family protein
MVVISIDPANKNGLKFPLHVRIPGWAIDEAFPTDLYRYKEKSSDKPSINVNGQIVEYSIENGYAILERAWKKGDKVMMTLPMKVKQVVANEKVKDNIGKIAIERGPIVYCAEFVDNNGLTSNLIVPENQNFATEFQTNLLNGVMTIRGSANALNIENNASISTKNQPLVLIPYYARSNRGQGEMRIWFPTRIKNLEIMTE